MSDGYGIGPGCAAEVDCAAEILIVFGDNPGRIRFEAAFEKLWGTVHRLATPLACHAGLQLELSP